MKNFLLSVKKLEINHADNFAGYTGSVDAGIEALAASREVDLQRSKVYFAMERVRAYIARNKEIQQRNLERRIAIERQKGTYLTSYNFSAAELYHSCI